MRTALIVPTLLVLLLVSKGQASAQQYEPGGYYNQCIGSFYDPDMYNWYSYRNSCSETIRVTYCARNSGGGCYAMTLRSGRKDSTGWSRDEVNRKGGFTVYACREGWYPVDVRGEPVRPGTGAYRCRLSS